METTSNGTAETWRERITSQQASGQSIRVWCRDNGHHEHAFYWWRVRLGLSPQKRRRSRAKPIKFAEVVVNHTTVESMCLRLAGGRELVLPGSMAVDRVAALVRALEAAS
jgi:hypothetical protein